MNDGEMTMSKKILVAVVLGSAVLFSVGGYAADGKKVFNKCKACHSLQAGKNKVGPSLKGLVGRTAGAVEGYRYSKMLATAGQNGLVWDDQNLAQYLENPQKFLKAYLSEKGAKASGRSKMSFRLRKEKDAKAVIDYIKTQ